MRNKNIPEILHYLHYLLAKHALNASRSDVAVDNVQDPPDAPFAIRMLPVRKEPIGADERSEITPCLCYSQRCRWCAWRGVRGCTCCLRLFFFACANARPFIYIASRRSAESDSRAVVRHDVERVNAGDAACARARARETRRFSAAHATGRPS